MLKQLRCLYGYGRDKEKTLLPLVMKPFEATLRCEQKDFGGKIDLSTAKAAVFSIKNFIYYNPRKLKKQ
jgi:hypothetical protein